MYLYSIITINLWVLYIYAIAKYYNNIVILCEPYNLVIYARLVL